MSGIRLNLRGEVAGKAARASLADPAYARACYWLSFFERGELFRSIANTVTRMTKMLEDILVIGKSDAERIEINPASISLDVYCRELVDALAAE